MAKGTLSRLTIAGFLAVSIAGVLLRPLLPIDETRYLAVAWEMWLSGDFFVPTKNFAPYAHKPPLLFWLINLVWYFTGISETAARLVGPVAAALTIGLTGHLAGILWPDDEQIRTRAVLALAGSMLFAVSGGLTMFDALLALTVVSAMIALVRAIQTSRIRFWVAVGAAIGIGVLAKGPVVLIHTFPAILAVSYWAGVAARPNVSTLVGRIAIVLCVAAAIVAIWLVPAILIGGPDYREAILWTQSAGRITQSFAHARPWWFFLALLPLLLFPWSLVPAIWRASLVADWSETGLKLAVVWGVTALLLFSLISGKQIHYLIPELPAVALIVARLTRGVTVRPLIPALSLYIAALVAVAGSAGLLSLGDIGPFLSPSSAILAWALFLVTLSWAALQTGGLLGTVALTLGTVLSLNLLIGVIDASTNYDTHHIARLLAPHERSGLAAYGKTYNAEFNFAGRLTARVATLSSPDELSSWTTVYPDGVIVSKVDLSVPPWQPRTTMQFRTSRYGVWHVADAPQNQ